MWKEFGMLRRFLMALLSALALPAAAAKVEPSDIPGWQQMVFSGHTRWQQGEDCVLATAERSASGLVREVTDIDVVRQQLAWGWRVDAPLQPGNMAAEKTRDGDDFVARVYVVKKGFFPWQTYAINYVWSREHPVGSAWPNPFTGNAMMVVVESGDVHLGEWREYRRDVRADFRRYHDMEIDSIDALAVMTDTDNTEGVARACYRLPAFVVP
jgi:hypothetical protein